MSFSLINSFSNIFAKATVYQYKHDRTHCNIVHVYNDDPENVFAFAIPTHPKNSNGVAHILEHTVLCGSEKYKSKSPFLHMFKSSCKTFLNALTYPDRTIYPAASTVKEDLFNLMDVYIDAVWFPLLDEHLFRQEGFYLVPPKSDSELPTGAGVVYNEMKGAYSERDSIISEYIYKELLKGTLYEFDSGGYPHDIPSLTYKEFIDFHTAWYRPEHTHIILYGNIPTEEYLSFLESHLARWKHEVAFEKSNAQFSNRDKSINHEKNIVVSVPAIDNGDEYKNQFSVDICWMLPQNTLDILSRMSMSILHTVLVGITGAPLRKRLIDSGYVDDISNLSGVDVDLYNIIYSIGVSGVLEVDVEKVKELIIESLAEVLEAGIDEKLVQAALSRIEFSLKESLATTNSKVNWVLGIARVCLYDGDVETSIELAALLEILKEKLADPQYLIEFGRKYLLENMQYIVVVGKPDVEYDTQMQEQEQNLLSTLWDDVSQKKYWTDMSRHVMEESQKEDSIENIKSIPMLTIDTLPKKIETWTEEHDTYQNIPYQWVHSDDNGIVYVWCYFDITDIVYEHSDFNSMLPTLAASFTDIGLTNMPYEILSSSIRSTTGRLSAIVDNFSSLSKKAKAYLCIHMSVLHTKLDEAISLLNAIIHTSDFTNNTRMKQIINEGKSFIRSRLIDGGMQLAIMKAALPYSALASIDDAWHGANQLSYLVSLKDTEVFLQSMQCLAKKIYAKNRMSYEIVADIKHKKRVLKSLDSIACNLERDMTYTSDHSYDSDIISTVFPKKAFLLSSQVAYNALVMKAVRYNHNDYVAYDMFSRIVTAHLWESIRMRYGAYGAGAALAGSEGLIEFYTYRDPNVAESFDAFKDAVENIARRKWERSELDRMRVGVIGESLQPLSPLQKGKVAHGRYIRGITNELRQDIRDKIFLVSPNMIEHVAKEVFSSIENASRATVCSKMLADTYNWDSVEYLPQ